MLNVLILLEHFLTMDIEEMATRTGVFYFTPNDGLSTQAADYLYPAMPSAKVRANTRAAIEAIKLIPDEFVVSVNFNDRYNQIVISSHKEKFMAWLKENHFSYTDRVEYNEACGGFWSHFVTVPLESGAEIGLWYSTH